jgi:hypothetical protein
MPSHDLRERDETGYERQLDGFENRYWSASVMNGAIPKCHEGCALRIWLVVTGEQAEVSGMMGGVTSQGSSHW